MRNNKSPTPNQRENLIYGGIIFLIIIGIFAVWKFQHNPLVAELNNLLQEDAEISQFDYPFRVLSVHDRIASVSTPRSPEVSVLRYLALSHKELDVSNPDSPEMIAAQKDLARIQSEVRKRIVAHPGIDKVQWQLDKQWYLQHGVEIR